MGKNKVIELDKDLTLKELVRFCKNKRKTNNCSFGKCPFYHNVKAELDCDSGIYNKEKWDIDIITKIVRTKVI